MSCSFHRDIDESLAMLTAAVDRLSAEFWYQQNFADGDGVGLWNTGVLEPPDGSDSTRVYLIPKWPAFW